MATNTLYPVTTRAQARASGAKRYFTGVPCASGHIEQRLTSNAGCMACARIRASWGKMSPEQQRRAVERAKIWKAANKDKVARSAARYGKEYNSRPSVAARKQSDEFRERNKLFQLAYRSKQEAKEKRREWGRLRWRNDPDFVLRSSLRLRLRLALKGRFKAGSAVRLLGCSPDQAVAHITKQFKDGMSWDNHGAWHIDHILPLSRFDLTNPIELARACHFSNLQPLWAVENIKKGAKIMESIAK